VIAQIHDLKKTNSELMDLLCLSRVMLGIDIPETSIPHDYSLCASALIDATGADVSVIQDRAATAMIKVTDLKRREQPAEKPVSPYLEYKWWYGPNEELFTEGPFDTRDAAVDFALSNDGGVVVEARKSEVSLSSYIDVDDILEQAEERSADDHGWMEDCNPLFDLSSDDINSLERYMRGAVDKWQSDRELTFVPRVFSEVRNTTFVKAGGPPIS